MKTILGRSLMTKNLENKLGLLSMLSYSLHLPPANSLYFPTWNNGSSKKKIRVKRGDRNNRPISQIIFGWLENVAERLTDIHGSEKRLCWEIKLNRPSIMCFSYFSLYIFSADAGKKSPSEPLLRKESSMKYDFEIWLKAEGAHYNKIALGKP